MNRVINFDKERFKKIITEDTKIIYINCEEENRTLIEFYNIYKQKKKNKNYKIIYFVNFDNENVKSTIRIIKKIKKINNFCKRMKIKIGIMEEVN